MNHKLIAQEKLNDFRAVLRIVESPEFVECIAINPNDSNVVDYIKYGKVDELKNWLRSKLRAEINDYTIRELRSLAGSLGIPNYCSKRKSVLLSEILRKQRASKIAAITKLVPLVETDFESVFSGNEC
jgi:hypothetical protein